MKMIGKQNSVIIIVLQITIISLVQTASAQEQVEFAGGVCADVSITSIYHDNVDTLLDTFINQSSSNFFFESSSGDGNDQVNGLYVCRPDISSDTCKYCINVAVESLRLYCFTSSEAFIWYDECMVRYSNDTVSESQVEPSRFYSSVFNVSQPDKFPGIRNKTLQGIITKASMPENKERFAFNSSDFTPFEGFYGMAWCTPNIIPSQCESCLTTALSTIDGVAMWVYVLSPSCALRYDTAPFIFPASSTPALAPASR